MAANPTPSVTRGLDETTASAIRDLITRVWEHDGTRPVSDHVWLHLTHPDPGGHDDRELHVVAAAADAVVGYGHLDLAGATEEATAELAVDPAYRRRGLGRDIVLALVDAADGEPMHLWAHGTASGAGELATSLGFVRSRTLWQMRRPLSVPLPAADLEDGIDVRPFRVGIDESAWLALNARAFVALPDQGGWTLQDLEQRIDQPWFSAEGFLMAWRDETLVGFHWTKIHEGHDFAGHHHDAIGEVYVVGVDPDYRGRGLGRTLTILGLEHLVSRGLTQAMLYVDGQNTAAIALYDALGFIRWDTDVQFLREG